MAFAPVETLFEEIIDFLASSLSAEQLVTYQSPAALQERFSKLLEKNRSRGLSEAEQCELDEFLRMNRFMSRLKLKAHKRLN